jgi:hypothetical protein
MNPTNEATKIQIIAEVIDFIIKLVVIQIYEMEK